MQRHDTHLLSDNEEEEEERSDEIHKYSFNNSKHSYNNSENNSLYINNSNKNSPFKLSILKNDNNNNNNSNLKNDNISIISSKELEDIFYNENNSPIKKDNKEKNNSKNDKDKNVVIIKQNNKDNNKNQIKKESITKKRNTVIDNIKIKMLKLNDEFNNNGLQTDCLTYRPCLKYKIENRNCISLDNSFIKSKKNIKKTKNTVNKNNKKKKIKLLSNCQHPNYNNDINKKNRKNIIDIINQTKMKSLKISKNSFSIKTKLLDEYKNNHYNNYNNINKKDCLFEFNNKVQHQNDFFFQKTKYHNIKRINYFPSDKVQINGKKQFQYIQQGKKNKDNYNSFSNLISSNNSRYSNRSKKNKYIMNTINKYTHTKKINIKAYLKLQNDKKIKKLYDLYCKKQEPSKKNMPRIKSAFSLFEHKHNIDIYQKSNNKINFKNHNRLSNYLKYNPRKNWIFRLVKLQKGKDIYNYDKHFGNTESCPLCQEMDKKNEESIIKKGISPLIHENKNKKNNSKSSLHNRRIYSAYSKYDEKKNKNESSKSEINNENENDNDNKNNDDKKTINVITNKNVFNNIMLKIKNKNKNPTNNLKRKLVLHKGNNLESIVSYSNNQY